jgi:hypothetical protein
MGLSARAAAKALNLTHPALLKAAKSGRVTREIDGTYDVDTVRRQLAENSNAAKRRNSKKLASERVTTPVTSQTFQNPPNRLPASQQGAMDGQNRTFAEAQRRREWLRVERDRIELMRKRSELVPIAEINAFVAGMIIRAREILVRIAPELKDRLAQTANPHECETLVAGEVFRALNELAEYRPAL